MAGKIQNEDVKSEAELIGLGATKTELIHDTKIYSPSIGKTLDQAIADGDIGGGGGGGLDVFFTQAFDDEVAADWTYGNNATFLGAGAAIASGVDETVDPITGTTSIKHTQIASSLNDFGASPAFTIDNKQGEGGQTVRVSLYYKLTATTTDDYALVVYDATNSAVISRSSDLLVPVSKPTRFETSFFIPDGVTDLRYGYQVVNETIGAVLTIDDFEFTTNPYPTVSLTEDIKVEYRDNNGVALTANVTDATWKTKITDDDNLWNGTQFTTPYDGVFHFTGALQFNGGAANTNLYTYIGGTVDRILNFIHTAGNDGAAFACELELTQGDLVSFRVNSGVNITSGTTNNWIQISGSKRSDHIITPLDNVQPIRYSSSSGQSIPNVTQTIINYGDVAYDKDGLVTVGASWKYTASTDGVYNVSAGVGFATLSMTPGQGVTFSVYKNGALSSTLFYSEWEGTGNFGYKNSGSADIDLVKGDFIDIRVLQGSGAASNLTALATTNYVSIHRVDKSFVAAIAPTAQTAYLHGEKPAQTNAGTFTALTWVTRELDVVTGDSTIVSLVSDQFILEAGKYEIEASAPAYAVAQHKVKIYNITDASDITPLGTAEISGSSGSRSFANLTIEITAQKTFELRHMCQTGAAGSGLGRAQFTAGFGVEVYATVKIKKVG